MDKERLKWSLSKQYPNPDDNYNIRKAAENWLMILNMWDKGHGSLTVERLVKGPECSVLVFPNIHTVADTPEEALRQAGLDNE